MEFFGYERADGQVGARNHVAVIPSVICADDVAQAIVHQVHGTRGLLHHQGCCQLPPDLVRFFRRDLAGLEGLPEMVGNHIIRAPVTSGQVRILPFG